MSDVPVTGMSSREFNNVFGVDPTPIQDDETIIDVGSGLSNLDTIAPAGFIAQLDPIYDFASDNGHCFRIPIALGGKNLANNTLLSLIELGADRVTCGNTLKHLERKERIAVLSQLLRLSVKGIAQIYPVSAKKTNQLVEVIGNEGLEAIVQKPKVRGRRQMIYRASRINSVLTILSQPAKIGPTQQLRVARSIAEAL